VIREQMEQTRASLSDKLGALETQVRDTIQSATSAVTTTVDDVKNVVESVTDTVSSVKESVTETAQTVSETVTDTVQSTIESVKETFDICGQVERHPWGAIGCAFGLGLTGGLLLGSSEKPVQPTAVGAPPPAPPPAPAPVAAPAAASHEPSVFDKAVDKAEEGLGRMFQSVRGLAFSALFGLAREMVRSALPEQLHGDLNHLLDDMSQALGGKRAMSSAELEKVLPSKKEEEEGHPEAHRPEERRAETRPAQAPTRNDSRQRVGSHI